MRIFLTGATGFVGSALVTELIQAGHHVIGMARSEVGAQALLAAGAEVHHGSIEDQGSLRSGAANSDGVIHTAFDHDFSRFAENCEKDKRAIEALGAALIGTDRPLVITSVTWMGSAEPGQPATEDVFNAHLPTPRVASEVAVEELLKSGVNVSVVRLPQVHNQQKQGLITPLIGIAREKGASAYVGDGRNKWPAVHLQDAARLYRLAIEKQEIGARYHAVSEVGIEIHKIAEAIGRGLNIPVVSLSADESAEHFGWMGMFVGLDFSASGARTQSRLGWHATGPQLLTDLNEMDYSVERG